MAKKSKIVFAVFLFALFAKCASQIGPTGGEVDKTPPKIIESFPVDGTTNFKGNYFEISFSEYVEHRSVQEAIFISPALENGLEYDWSGKTLTVEFRDTLLENTTYTVTLGTDISDLNNGNKMERTFAFAFSTGNKIDKGKISGKVFGDKSEGVMIYAYQKKGEMDPVKEKPNYVSQIGKTGNYSIVGLRNGEYQVLAVRDKLKDMLYQRNEDEYGVQFTKIYLTDSTNNVMSNDYFMTLEDTISPKISSAYMKDRNHIIFEFSEAIDSSQISAANFYLLDTLNNSKIFPKYFFKQDAKPNQFYISFEDTSSFKEYFLIAENFADINSNKTSKDKIQFIYKAEKDTIPIKILKVAGDLPEDKVDYETSVLNVSFNDGIDIQDIIKRIRIEDIHKNRLNYAVNKNDDAQFTIKMKTKLKPGSQYTVLFNAKDIPDLSGKNIDTVYQTKFTTCNELDFSGISGTVSTKGDYETYIVLEKTVPPKQSYKQRIDQKNKFDFKRVLPGKYLVWGFKDRNKNGRYDCGTIYPFNLSEQFKFYPDTLNLRARWPVGDVKINLDE